MGLSQPPSDISPQRGEQSQPLDLRTNHNCTCKSPPFQKRRYWFYQNEPLDLRIRQYNIRPSFHSVGSINQETNAFIGTERSQSNVSTLNQQKFPSVHQFKKVFSKCYPNENIANTQNTSKSSTCALFPFDLTGKKNQIILREDTTNAENASESISCARVPPNLSFKEIEKTSVGRKVFQTLESLTVNAYYNSSNETRSEYLTETIKNIPLLLENNELEISPINTDNLSINKYNRDSNTKYLHAVEISNYKSNKTKRISKRKFANESPDSIMTINQELDVKECEDDNNKIECFKDNVEAGVYGIGKNLEQDEESNPKKLKIESSVPPSLNLFTKPNVKQLKKTGESFLQDGKCFEVAPKLPRCRECSVALKDSLGKTQLGSDNVLCRFYAFRKLRYSTKGFLATAGFLDPHSDITQEDLRLWQPTSDMPLPDLDLQMARFMLTHVGDQFCDLCRQEEEAVAIHMSEDKKVAWKRPVPGCREMCDVCNTTLFNFHWTCRTCGFAVCIDCYKARKGCIPKGMTIERPWLICVNKRAHDQEKMMLTQITAADSLKHLGRKAHDIRTYLGLPLHCCGRPTSSRKTPTTSQSDNLLNEFSAKEINLDSETFDKNSTENEEDLREKVLHPDSFDDATNCLISINKTRTVSFEDYCSGTGKYLARVFNTLRKRLTKQHLKNAIPCHVPSNEYSTENNITHEDMFEEVILTVFDQDAVDDADATVVPHARRLVHRYNSPPQHWGGPIPSRVMTLSESRLLYPDCPHSWLCAGRLLKLSDPGHAGNCTVFQDQWKRGQPVLVSGVLKFLDEGLWQPDSFIKDFGGTKNDLVNCMTGRVIPGQYMRKFWEGFQEVSKMLKDEKGNPMLLKLKDWPPGEDFAEMLPSRTMKRSGEKTLLKFFGKVKKTDETIASETCGVSTSDKDSVTAKPASTAVNSQSSAPNLYSVPRTPSSMGHKQCIPNGDSSYTSRPESNYLSAFMRSTRTADATRIATPTMFSVQGVTRPSSIRPILYGECETEYRDDHRFEDLMQALPMGEYTKRTGQLNLPSRLPSTFARPDLGPKMYIAYGSAIHPTKGTTNLHLDISDAVNVMVYVGIPKDIDCEKFINEAYRAVDEACFEMLMRRRVRKASEVPGALWHIYSARDSDKIRHLLTRVARERRIKLGPHQDPIHDQNWYLDAALRERLYKEYDVLGYAIVQCLGDAVFIPAGAPHQVRNLLNCIKVAEDFVSPENVSHCLHLTQEFRKLSDFHSNHEDKLQIKNIIYHAVKDSVSVLSQ